MKVKGYGNDYYPLIIVGALMLGIGAVISYKIENNVIILLFGFALMLPVITKILLVLKEINERLKK